MIFGNVTPPAAERLMHFNPIPGGIFYSQVNNDDDTTTNVA
jgi:hypothetical protein